MQSRSFEQFGGILAVLSAISGLLYSISFIVLQNSLFSGLFLMLLGILSTAALMALYYRLRHGDPAFALWSLLMGLAGAVGAAIHGGYDLSNAVNPLAGVPSAPAAQPSQVDPRGLLTFLFAGIALFFFSWLISRSVTMPRGLGYLGYLSAILLIILYLGRLIILDPANPIVLIPALLNGFVIYPIWLLWLGITLLHPTMIRTSSYQGPERRVIERRQVQI